MAHIDNRTGLPHAWFQKTGPGGARFDVLVVRATFDFAPHGKRIPLAQTQTPIVWGDEFDGPAQDDPLRAVLKREGDLVLYKPRADIHVTGHAQPDEGHAQRRWLAGIAVGGHKKLLQLHGPRHFEAGLFGWRLTTADPTARIALDYRNAFGGCFSVPAGYGEAPAFAYKRDNPAGCGWLPEPLALKTLSRRARRRIEAAVAERQSMPAPQIEDPERPVKTPYADLPTEGLSPMARWSEPRLRHAGTYDEAWRTQRNPLPPEDFDPAFYQSAHPDLILRSHLNGDETVVLHGLLAEGHRTMFLPSVRVLGAVTHNSGKKTTGPLTLDTARVELDTRQIVLLWRAAFERHEPRARNRTRGDPNPGECPMSGNRDVLILPNPPAGDIEADLYALNRQLNDLAGREQKLSHLLSLYDQKDALAPLSAAEKEARKKYLGELQQVQNESAQLGKERTELAKAQAAAAGGTSRHIAHEMAPWKAVCIDPDCCFVGDLIVPFDSFAIISQKAKASPNVKARGTPVYRVDDLHHSVCSDAGAHIEAGTSLGGGYVKFTEGQSNVYANGIQVVRHDNECLINCNAAGKGGALGKVVTDQVPAQSSPSFVEQADALSKKLHVKQGIIKNAYDLGVREMSSPNNSWFDRGVYLLGATATLPAMVLEEMGRGLMNIPSAAAGAIPQAAQGGENIGVTLDSSLPAEDRVIGGLAAVRDFSFAFLGLGAIFGFKPMGGKPVGGGPPARAPAPVETPPVAPAGGVWVAGKGGATNESVLLSSNELSGVERASQELLDSVGNKRAITWATDGSDALRYLEYRQAEAAALGAEDVILRSNPSKAAVLEEFLHGTQQKLGIIDKLGTSGMGSAETHVKDFMIRHQDMLGLSPEDVRRLQILKDMGL